jgi:formylglycine-generating enzyme required for sulfatase activity
MAGNVYDWTETPASAERLVIRGGNWYGVAHTTRCADRFAAEPTYTNAHQGMRVARSFRRSDTG